MMRVLSARLYLVEFWFLTAASIIRAPQIIMVKLIIAYSSMVMVEDTTHALLFSGVSRIKKSMYRKTTDIRGRPTFNTVEDSFERG